MKNICFKTDGTNQIAKNTWEMVLNGDVPAIKPGQFVNIELPGRFLRRPFSVCDWSAETLTVVFKTVGAGTEQMTQLPEGAELDVLAPLGNGFDPEIGERPVLAGGGAGVAPMYGLARTLAELGREFSVVLGFNTAAEVFYKERFEALGCRTVVTTADGSLGVRGFVTEGMKLLGDAGYVYACGPEPMLKAVYNASPLDGQYSFEARMGCGFGACVGCTRRTKNGYKRICKDGPVLYKEEILWEK